MLVALGVVPISNARAPTGEPRSINFLGQAGKC